jgi:RsiW-degrading membrane proteinase PrsW (M82 family)
MSEPGVAVSPSAGRAHPGWGSGSIAIVVTILVTGAWGAVGLAVDQPATLAIVGPAWVAISLGFWVVYGLVMLLLVRKPARRAEVLRLGTVLAMVWGGLAATDLAARANTAVSTIAANSSPDTGGAWTTWAIAPAFEETIKTAGIVLLALLPAARRFGPAAGLAVGALVGVSFQVVENWEFTLQAMEHSLENGGTPLSALLSMAFIRGVVGIFSHVVYSGVIGAAIGWALATGPGHRARRVGAVVLAWVLMVALHMWSNWTTTAGAGLLYLVTMALGLAVFVVVYRAVARWRPVHPGPPLQTRPR